MIQTTSNHLLSLLADHKRTHGNYQIDRFIVAKSGLTTYGRYRQAVRELHGRFGGIRDAILLREEIRIDLEEAQERQGQADHLKVRRAALAERRAEIRLRELESRVDGLCYEFARFYLLATQLKEALGPMDAEAQELHERELMLAQVRKTIAAIQWDGGPGKAFDLICCLPQVDRATALEWMRDPGAQSNHFLHMPEPVEELPPTSGQVHELRAHVERIVHANLELTNGSPPDAPDGIAAQDADVSPGLVLQGHP